ncbi:GMC oxidoreductase [Litorivivens sp.]|uniref:GMC oxidoreductase n=1 Tax=Litorivivens sp. TaxID=2020868 RepID=UPI003566A023
MSATQTQDFDAIVVGSGISGGWAAKELTEKGLKVLVLERGAPIRHGLDYKGEHMPPWKIPYAGKPLRELYKEEYPIQSKVYAFNETTRHFFNNDKNNPYVYNPSKPFNWKRADVLGGRSLLWGRQVYRWSDLDFEANKRDGHGIDWPIRYKDIAPWYSYVEKFAGVSGEKLNLPHLPDGEFQKPMNLNAVERTAKERIEKQYPGRVMTIGRAAVQTEPKNGRGACHYCGPCERGCSAGAYFSSLSSTLPAAEKTGNLTIRADSVVENLEYDKASGKVSAVNVIDANTKERIRFTGKLVFLCASTIASTQILLNSTSEHFPNGLANRSGVLGRYLMDHTSEVGSFGVIPGFMDKYTIGNRPNGIYIPRFRNLPGQDESVDFIRGYGIQGGSMRMNWAQMHHQISGFGARFKQALRAPGPWVFFMAGFGEHLPDKNSRMMLSHTKRDRFGIPQVEFDSAFGDNEERMRKDILEQTAAMLKAAGARNVMSFDGNSPPGGAIHEMGTARMGEDPTQSVLNRWNQAHDIPNLFVTDGSCMTSSSCVNPSLTYMALTARAADYAVTQLRAGKI